jgi:hypothetical protein
VISLLLDFNSKGGTEISFSLPLVVGISLHDELLGVREGVIMTTLSF